MMCFIYLLFVVFTFRDGKNTSIFFCSIFSGRKINLFGTLGGKKSKILISFFKSDIKTNKKIRENFNFNTNPIFDVKSILILGLNPQQMIVNT